MTPHRFFTIPILILALCGAQRSHTADANDLTARYGSSRFAKWRIRGKATGPDGSLLCVSIGIVVDDSMIQALHYGSGLYDVYPGGIQGFMKDRRFRAVTYTDKTGRKWGYARGCP